jgi:hypothetical protein
MSSKTKQFRERDIIITDMRSRSGKATENLYLSIAKVKKLQRDDEQLTQKNSANFLRDRRSQLQNTKTIVTPYCFML